MNWTEIDTWIVVIGALCAMSCAIPGSILVLRRMSLMGDAISHTVLPGIAIAFLITGSRDPTAMLIGAVVIGLITAFLVQAIQTLGKVEIGASMGIVFTVLFAFGLVLMRQAIDHVDIDPDCVLNGAIEFAWFDQTPGGLGIPRGAMINGLMLLTNLILVILFYKEFKITAFDPSLAKAQGIQPSLMHYLLMTMTATTAVAAFETVGSILVVAMFIVPPATAYLITDRYSMIFILALLFAIASAGIGHLSAITVPTWFGYSGTTTAGAMAVATGVLFFVAWMFSPKQGFISKLFHNAKTRAHILREDVLGLLWRAEERCSGILEPKDFPHLFGVSSKKMHRTLRLLLKQGAIQRVNSSWTLTSEGRSRAARLIRSHRLWEVYLDKHFPQDTHQLHHAAERLEHITTSQMREKLGNAEVDPHGSSVPDDEM